MLECWKESRLVLENIDFSKISQVPDTNIVSSIVIAALAVTVIVFFKSEILAVSLSLQALFNGKKVKDIEGNQSYYSAVVVTAIICIPILAATAMKPGSGNLTYALFCAALFLLVVVRKLLFSLVSWLKGRRDVFKTSRHSSAISLIDITVLCLPLLIFRSRMPDIFMIIVQPYILTVIGLVYAIYLARSLRTLISSGFSHFFSFLYICALELLPIGLIISVYISL